MLIHRIPTRKPHYSKSDIFLSTDFALSIAKFHYTMHSDINSRNIKYRQPLTGAESTLTMVGAGE